MNRYFNITGCCNPQEHYMVNLDSRLAQIKKMIDRGQYFSINKTVRKDYNPESTTRISEK